MATAARQKSAILEIYVHDQYYTELKYRWPRYPKEYVPTQAELRAFVREQLPELDTFKVYMFECKHDVHA